MRVKLRMWDAANRASKTGSVETPVIDIEQLRKLAEGKGFILLEVSDGDRSVWKTDDIKDAYATSDLQIEMDAVIASKSRHDFSSKQQIRGALIIIGVILCLGIVVGAIYAASETREERYARGYKEALKSMAPATEKSVLELHRRSGYRDCQFCITKNDPYATTCKACGKEMRLDHQPEQRTKGTLE